MHLAEILVKDVAVLLDLYALCILAWAFMSFFPNSYASPIGHLLEELVMPVIRPLRRVLPMVAGLDFSPLLALVLVYAVAQLLEQPRRAFDVGEQEGDRPCGELGCGMHAVRAGGQRLRHATVGRPP